MKIGFIMDPPQAIAPVNETTSHLMYECNQRGHKVYCFEPHDIYVRANQVVARMFDVSVARDLPIPKYWDAVITCLNDSYRQFDALADLDALFLRANPPLNYQALEFLSPLSDRVFMINNILGQIQGNSKLYTLNFPDLIPESHVSRDPNRLKKIIEGFGGAMVMKPLQRFGGEGVIKVSTQDRENLQSLIRYYVRAQLNYPEREPIMVQEYLPAVRRKGDVRILLLNGEILGAMRRKAQGGEFRTNIHAGANALRHEITRKEREICEAIKPRLQSDGLYFVGIDLIDERLVEVNCVSPGGIPRINRLNHVCLEASVIDFVETTVTGTIRGIGMDQGNYYRDNHNEQKEKIDTPLTSLAVS